MRTVTFRHGHVGVGCLGAANCFLGLLGTWTFMHQDFLGARGKKNFSTIFFSKKDFFTFLKKKFFFQIFFFQITVYFQKAKFFKVFFLKMYFSFK